MSAARRIQSVPRSIKHTDWPYFDRLLLERALADGDDLLATERGPAARWSLVTRRKRIYGYGAWLAFLERHGWLEYQVNPRARVTPAALRCYVEELQAGYASLSVWNFVDDLDAMLRAMLPDEDWSLVRRVAARLKARSHRARPIEPGLPQARELYQAGLAAMREAEAGNCVPPLMQAVAYRDPLAVTLLAACPLRRRTGCWPRSTNHHSQTWASLRIMRGLPLMVAAQVLGNSDTRMVEKHYGHLAKTYISDAIELTTITLPDEPGQESVVRMAR